MSPRHPSTAVAASDERPHGQREGLPGASTDRRQAYRIPLLPGDGRVLLSHAIRSPLQDISASGASIVVRPGTVRPGWSGSALLELTGNVCFPVQLSLVRSAREGAAQVLGAQLSGLTPTAQRALSQFMFAKAQTQTWAANPQSLLDAAPSVRIRDRDVIERIVRQHAEDGTSTAWIYQGGQRLPVELVLRCSDTFGAEQSIVGRFRADSSGFEPGESSVFVITGGRALYVFTTTILEMSRDHIVAAIPTEVVQAGFRQSPRFVCDCVSTAHLEIREHRRDNCQLVAQVQDVGARGLSLVLDADCPTLFPGDRIDRLLLRVADASIEARARIRSLRMPELGRKLICGVELLEFPSPQHEEEWHRFVLRTGHRRSHPVEHRARIVWDILVDSKYIELWTPREQAQRLRRQFTRAWTRPDPAVSQAIVLEDGRGPVGTLAGSLAYPHTWMLHHMGITEAARQQGKSWLDLGRELYSAVMYGLEHLTDLEHFVIYLEDGKRWNDFVYGRFAAGYDDSANLRWDKMLVFRGFTHQTTDGRPPAALPGNWSIQPTSPRLWTMLSNRLCATRSQLEIDAYALDQQRITLAAFTRECKEHGYERRRQAFVACHDGEPRAAILVDSGSEGVNVFGLMNTCWIADFGRPPLPRAVKAALLQRASAWYRSRGKRSYLFFQPTPADSEDRDALKTLDIDFVSDGVRWLSDRRAMAAWAASVEDLLRPPHS